MTATKRTPATVIKRSDSETTSQFTATTAPLIQAIELLVEIDAIHLNGNTVSSGPTFLRHCVFTILHDELQRIDPRLSREGNDA